MVKELAMMHFAANSAHTSQSGDTGLKPIKGHLFSVPNLTPPPQKKQQQKTNIKLEPM